MRKLILKFRKKRLFLSFATSSCVNAKVGWWYLMRKIDITVSSNKGDDQYGIRRQT